MNNLNVYKRIFIILAAAMFFCVACCLFVAAASEAEATDEYQLFGGGNGTAQSPYIITNEQDMIALMNSVNNITAPDGYFGRIFKVSQDIDLTEAEFKPIGNFTYPFKGKFYGEGHTIRGLDISEDSDSYSGLFGVTSVDAVIDNLIVYGNVCGYSYTGGIVGFNNGTVSRCVNNAAVSNQDDNSVTNIGGICGYNKGTISNSINKAVVSGHGVNTGGIAGLNDSVGEIRDCFNVGEINSFFYDAGGIVGHNDGTVDGCFNSVEIKAYSTVGGIAGSNTGTVSNVYNAGDIVAQSNIAGGISGSSDGEISKAYSRAKISAASLKYGICGYVSENAVLNACFLNSDKFSGRMTNRGDSYLNSSILSDYEMTLPDVLEEDGLMETLQSDGKWTKRVFGEYCYLPELSSFYDNESEETKELSKSSVAIDRQIVESVQLGTLSYVYNGHGNEPDVYSGEKKYVRDVDYNVVFENNVNAGTAKANISFINFYKGDAQKYFDIEKSVISVEWIEREIVFNGESQHPFVEIKDGRVGEENVTFSYTGAGENVGEYEVTVQLEESEVNSNYTFVPISKKYNILQSQLQIVWDSAKIEYNGQAQFPQAKVISGVMGDDKIVLNYLGYENNIIAGQDYTVTVSVSGNSNYSLIETHTYNIDKKRITATFENKVFTYNGEPQYPTIVDVQGVVLDEIILFDYFNYENNISVNDCHKVYAQLSDNTVNNNYEFEKQECQYAIVEKELTINRFGKNPTYNGKAQYPKFEVDGIAEGDCVDWIISDYSGNIQASEGDKYSIDVTLADCKNYIFQPISIHYDILPMEITVAWNSEPLIYNGHVQRPQAFIVENTPDIVELIYSNFDGKNVGKDYGINIDANNRNYIVVNDLKYDILPKPISVTWDDGEFIYNGAEQYPYAQISDTIDETVDFEYIKEVSAKVNTYSISIRSKNSNYCFENETFSYVIKPKKISLSDISAENRAYDGSIDAKLQGGNLVGLINDDSIQFVISNAVAENPNAGNWKVNYDIVLMGDNADCYVVDKPVVEINICKAVFDLNQLKFESKTFAFDGNAKSLAVEGDVPDCIEIKYDGNNKIDVGEYVVTARFIDNYGNFETIPEMQTKMYVANSTLVDSSNAISVSAYQGILPYGTQLKINKTNNWQGAHRGKMIIGVYKISLSVDDVEIQTDYKLKIVMTLDKKGISLKNLAVMQGNDSNYEKINFTIEDDRLIFYTDNLSEIVLIGDKNTDWIWYVLSVIFVIIVVALTLTYTTIRNKKRTAARINNNQEICQNNNIN